MTSEVFYGDAGDSDATFTPILPRRELADIPWTWCVFAFYFNVK